jgi:hypothetical protein
VTPSKGTLSNIARPRRSDSVVPGGSCGGGPPFAKSRSASEEKKRGSVCWNSLMRSSSSAVGSRVFCACPWMALNA